MTRLARNVISCAILALAGASPSYTQDAPAARPVVQVAYFVDGRMQDADKMCEAIVLSTREVESASLFTGGEKSSCEVRRGPESALLVRCGQDHLLTTTTYPLQGDGIVAVLVVFTKPELLASDKSEVESGLFDTDCEKRSLYSEGRRALHEYWLTVAEPVRARVRRAGVLVVAPAGGGVLQVQTWLE